MFCGSSPGAAPDFVIAATAVGRLLAEAGIAVVYGGGSAGLMGAVATGALDAGGDVIGVLPQGLFPDGVTASPGCASHRGTLVIEEVADMHARKARFHQLADAYIVLPGGLGTLEEWAEVATWGQIGLHDRPIGFLDVNGHFDALFAWLDQTVVDGFVRAGIRDQLVRSSDPAALITHLATARLHAEPKWH